MTGFATATPSRKRSRRSRAARVPSRAARTSSSAHGRARRRSRSRSSPSTGSEAARHRGFRRSPPPRRAGNPRRDRGPSDGARALHGAGGRGGDHRLAGDPRPRHDRRERHERVTRDGDGRAADVPRRDRHAPVDRGHAHRVRRRAVRRPGRHGRSSRRAARLGRRSVPRRGCGQRLRPARVPPTDGDRSRRSDRRRRPRRFDGDGCAGRDHGPRTDHPPRAGRGAGTRGNVGRRGCRAAAPPPRPRRLRSDLRRARLGALPRGDGRGDHAARDRRRAHPGARRRRPVPASGSAA